MIIGVDADDTLWVNEKYYQEVVEKTGKLISPYYDGSGIDKEMLKIEMSNLELFGYGAKGFILSLIETAVKVTEGKIPGGLVKEIILYGKELLEKPVVVFEGVVEALESMTDDGHELLLVTKGDLLDQRRKLAKSGLGKYFSHVEVMQGKSVLDYRSFFEKLSIDPELFVMIGDSVKSDVLPVLEAGGWAVHVQGGTSWEHEMFNGDIDSERFFRVEGIKEAASAAGKIAEKAGGGVQGEDESSVSVYTDGGCIGNPGPGGWAFIVSSGKGEIRRSGGDPDTTNNRMELTAVIESLKYITEDGAGSSVTIYTDSKYVRNGISQWIHNWEKNGWKTAAGKPVKNRDLWMELKKLSDQLNVDWKWVKGHSGDAMNEACDTLVREEMDHIRKKTT